MCNSENTEDPQNETSKPSLEKFKGDLTFQLKGYTEGISLEIIEINKETKAIDYPLRFSVSGAADFLEEFVNEIDDSAILLGIGTRITNPSELPRLTKLITDFYTAYFDTNEMHLEYKLLNIPKELSPKIIRMFPPKNSEQFAVFLLFIDKQYLSSHL